MPIPQIEDVRPILADFEEKIVRIVNDAWKEDWMSIPQRQRSFWDKTTRANCMFSSIRQRALTEFSEDSKVHPIPHGRTVKFLFGDRVLTRFKKANKLGLGSNINTQSVMEFVHPQIPLLSLPPIYHVEVCYQEDALATRIMSISVTYRHGSKKIWSYELPLGFAASVTPFPTPTPAPDGGGPAVVRLRELIEKKNDQE